MDCGICAGRVGTGAIMQFLLMTAEIMLLKILSITNSGSDFGGDISKEAFETKDGICVNSIL
jgi:hypothetical protein